MLGAELGDLRRHWGLSKQWQVQAGQPPRRSLRGFTLGLSHLMLPFPKQLCLPLANFSSSRSEHKCHIARELPPVIPPSELKLTTWQPLLEHLELFLTDVYLHLPSYVYMRESLLSLFPHPAPRSLGESGHCLCFVHHSIEHSEGAGNPAGT